MQNPAQQEEARRKQRGLQRGSSPPQNWYFTRSALIPVSLEALVTLFFFCPPPPPPPTEGKKDQLHPACAEASAASSQPNAGMHNRDVEHRGEHHHNKQVACSEESREWLLQVSKMMFSN